MTIVKHLNHLNLNTGEKTGIEVLFADWVNGEKLVKRRSGSRLGADEASNIFWQIVEGAWLREGKKSFRADLCIHSKTNCGYSSHN